MAGNRIGRHLSLATRRELIDAIAGRYHAAARTDKKKILDEFIEVTNFHRKHAIRVLRKVVAPLGPASNAPRARIYDEAVVGALTMLWEADDRICGKRLKAAIPALLDSMERHGHLKLDTEVRRLVLAVGAATIDRMLACTSDTSKQGRRKQGVNTPLRKSIAVRTFTVGTTRRRDFSRWIWWLIAASLSLVVIFIVWCSQTLLRRGRLRRRCRYESKR
jgi:hypothetical protein